MYLCILEFSCVLCGVFTCFHCSHLPVDTVIYEIKIPQIGTKGPAGTRQWGATSLYNRLCQHRAYKPGHQRYLPPASATCACVCERDLAKEQAPLYTWICDYVNAHVRCACVFMWVFAQTWHRISVWFSQIICSTGGDPRWLMTQCCMSVCVWVCLCVCVGVSVTICCLFGDLLFDCEESRKETEAVQAGGFPRTSNNCKWPL